MSSILKGIVDEGENVLILYIDGKPAAKYTNKYEAEKDVEHMRGRMPHRSFELKQEVDETELDENLRKWFKEKWVRFGPDGKIRGACARGSDKEGKPKCLPQKKAHALGKKGRKYAASKKRREDPNPERRGPAKNVATKKKTNEGIPFNVCPECGNEIVHESMMNEKKDACYHKVKARYKVWPSAYASGALVQCRKKGASNWGTGGKKNESNIMKGLVSEGVIVGHDANDPDVAILGGAGTYKLSNVKKKAQMEANELAKDVMDGKFKNSAINVKQLANTLNTIVAAEDEMEKKYFGEDYTGEFAAEVTPAINPYGGLKDKKVRGAIGEALLSETPTDNPTGSSGEGGWRKYSPKPAGELDEGWKMGTLGAFAGSLLGHIGLPPDAAGMAQLAGMIAGGYFGKDINSLADLRDRFSKNPEEFKKNMLQRKEVAKAKRIERGIAALNKTILSLDEAIQAIKNKHYKEAEIIFEQIFGIGVMVGTTIGDWSYLENDLATMSDNEEYLGTEPEFRNLDKIFKAFVKSPTEYSVEFANALLKVKNYIISRIQEVQQVKEDTAYAGGMGQGGNAGQSYRKFKPKSAGTFKEDELDEACWKGYHKEGNKKMFGKTYPNCVKNTNEEEQLDEKCWDSHKQVGMKKKGDKMVPNCVPKESAIMKGLTGKRR